MEKIICDRYELGESATSIGKSIGKQTSVITRILKRKGIELRSYKGENHPMWKGGRISKGDGYVGIWKPDHERSDKQGYVFEHTLVVEKEIGRLPMKGVEVVHHINLDKTDNRPENLYLCNHSEHISIHRQLDRMIAPLLDKRIIKFDRVEGKYAFTDENEKGRD